MTDTHHKRDRGFSSPLPADALPARSDFIRAHWLLNDIDASMASIYKQMNTVHSPSANKESPQWDEFARDYIDLLERISNVRFTLDVLWENHCKEWHTIE